jgi:hypothetical protein
MAKKPVDKKPSEADDLERKRKAVEGKQRARKEEAALREKIEKQRNKRDGR